MTAPATHTVEVLRPGTFTPMTGDPVTLTAADLAAIAAVYDAAAAPTPVVVGHPQADTPAYGWAAGFRFDAGRERLVAELAELAPEFEEAVGAGRYRKVSLSLFRPDAGNNPRPGSWYPKHVGFLGGAAPAVSGLRPVAFSADEGGTLTVELGEPALRDVAGLFRSIRDFLIEEHGLEVADRVVPDWSVRWIDEAGNLSADPSGPAFSEPAAPQAHPEVTMSDPKPQATPPADLAEREAKLAARAAALDHREHADFAERLIAEGRLTPVLKDRAIALLDGLAADGTVSFAEGGKTVTAAPRKALMDLLSALPKTITTGAVVPPEGGGAPSAVSFASPEGRAVDGDRLDVHARALVWQRAHPGTSYVDAVRAVDPTA